METRKQLHVNQLPITIQNADVIDLYQDLISDLPYYAFLACKACKKQAGVAAMQFFTSMMESTVDGMTASLNVSENPRSQGIFQESMGLFHPIAPKLKLLIESCDTIKQDRADDIRVAELEQMLLSFRELIVIRGDESLEHSWDAESVKHAFMMCFRSASASIH